jgi:hypothetical protein
VEGLAAKFVDAASMFWQALDERERMMLAYFGGYIVLSACLAIQRASRERLKRELRDEMVPHAHPG